MYGYDSPELKIAKSDPDRTTKIIAAKAARDFFTDLTLGKIFLAE